MEDEELSHCVKLARKHFKELGLRRLNFYGKPILGGELEARGLLMVKDDGYTIGENGVVYLVIDSVSKCPISLAATKAQALKDARRSVSLNSFDEYVGEYRRLHEEQMGLFDKLFATTPARDYVGGEYVEVRAPVRSGAPSVSAARPITDKKVPRRRLAIFNASEGKCHYCSTPLDLHGKWHIEHKMPKALMGGDEPSNLVASCAPCNFQKRDKTDLEFIAMQAQVAVVEDMRAKRIQEAA